VKKKVDEVKIGGVLLWGTIVVKGKGIKVVLKIGGGRCDAEGIGNSNYLI